MRCDLGRFESLGLDHDDVTLFIQTASPAGMVHREPFQGNATRDLWFGALLCGASYPQGQQWSFKTVIDGFSHRLFPGTAAALRCSAHARVGAQWLWAQVFHF